MSYILQQQAFRHSRSDGTTLLILLALASFVEHKTNTAFPSYTQLAKKARVSRRTAIRAIKKLVAFGEVTIIHSEVYGFRNMYQIAFPDIQMPKERRKTKWERDHEYNLERKKAFNAMNGPHIVQDNKKLGEHSPFDSVTDDV